MPRVPVLSWLLLKLHAVQVNRFDPEHHIDNKQKLFSVGFLNYAVTVTSNYIYTHHSSGLQKRQQAKRSCTKQFGLRG